MKNNSFAKNAEVETSNERFGAAASAERTLVELLMFSKLSQRGDRRLEDGGGLSCARNFEKVHET